MNALASIPVVGLGLYPLPEAARLAQLDTRTVRRWAEGYKYTRGGETHTSPGVTPLALSKSGGHVDLTFAELLTLRLVRAFRGVGLGLPTIKRVAAKAAQDFGSPSPLTSRRFRTDGRKIFVELRKETPANDEPEIPRREVQLIEVLTGQRQFNEVVEPSLFANVDWEDELAAAWWPLGKRHHVLLDPRVLFGAPHLSGTSVPTAPVAASVKAEGGGNAAIEAVAEWFGLTVPKVHAAVQFETEWLARAA